MKINYNTIVKRTLKAITYLKNIHKIKPLVVQTILAIFKKSSDKLLNLSACPINYRSSNGIADCEKWKAQTSSQRKQCSTRPCCDRKPIGKVNFTSLLTFQRPCAQVNLGSEALRDNWNSKTGSVSWAMMDRYEWDLCYEYSRRAENPFLKKKTLKAGKETGHHFPWFFFCHILGWQNYFVQGFLLPEKWEWTFGPTQYKLMVMLTKQSWFLPSSFSSVSLPPSPSLLPLWLLFIQ